MHIVKNKDLKLCDLTVRFAWKNQAEDGKHIYEKRKKLVFDNGFVLKIGAEKRNIIRLRENVRKENRFLPECAMFCLHKKKKGASKEKFGGRSAGWEICGNGEEDKFAGLEKWISNFMKKAEIIVAFLREL